MAILAHASQPPPGGNSTVARPSRGDGRFVRQSAGRGHYGHVCVTVAPSNNLHVRVEWMTGNQLPARWAEACVDGAKAAIEQPLAAGGRIVGVIVSIDGGSYHERDTDENAMRLAAALAVRDALSRAELVPV